MAKKKKNKKYNKNIYVKSSYFAEASPQQIHSIAHQIFGSTYYIDLKSLSSSTSL